MWIRLFRASVPDAIPDVEAAETMDPFIDDETAILMGQQNGCSIATEEQMDAKWMKRE